jgi:hypothetical protein
LGLDRTALNNRRIVSVWNTIENPKARARQK